MVTVNNKEFLIGCDPEIFVVGPDGHPASAYGLIPGTKADPLKVRNGMVQVDGMALEFGIDPASTKEEFIYRVKDVMQQLQDMLPKGYSLTTDSVVFFPSEVMKVQPEEALELGCDPDYNAYTLKKNPRPELPAENMRSAGGHVHIGWGSKFDPLDQRHIDACAALSAEMDYYVGAASLAWDKDALRRSIYGAAGAFRPKTYGMEYRSASNQWVMREETMGYVFDATVLAIESVMSASPKSYLNIPFFKGVVNLPAYTIINDNWGYLGEAIFSEVSKNVQR
jgi:hypothetical protein